MSEYKKLYKQIGELNNKIQKLESYVLNHNTNHKQKQVKPELITSKLFSYRIHFPKDTYSNKKYIGLKFDENSNNYDSDENGTGKNLLSFIKLSKSNIIINYTIQLDINYTPISSIPCSISIGIKTSYDSKIRIIKGTKYLFDIVGTNVIDNKFTISNNVLYSAEDGEELCVIVDFNFASGSNNCTINNKKSIIKLLYV